MFNTETNTSRYRITDRLLIQVTIYDLQYMQQANTILSIL